MRKFCPYSSYSSYNRSSWKQGIESLTVCTWLLGVTNNFHTNLKNYTSFDESILMSVVFPTDEEVQVWLPSPASLSPVQATRRKGPSVHGVGLRPLLLCMLVIKQFSLSPKPLTSQGSLLLGLELTPDSETPEAASLRPFLTGLSLSSTDLSSVFPNFNDSTFFSSSSLL